MLGSFANIVLGKRIGVFLFVLGFITALVLSAPETNSTPMSWGKDKNGKPVKPPAWNKGSTINIYIEADPDTTPPDRAALLREGMLRWQNEMAARGITINVTVGDPPNPPPAGTVRCTFEPSTAKLGNILLAGHDGLASCYSNGQNVLTSGKIYIRDDIPAGTTADQEYIRNIGEHEITHVLGLADDADGEVTNGTQYDDRPSEFNDTDRKEIGQLYPLTEEDTPKGDGNSNQSMDPNQYDWDFSYAGPPDEHVALITMDVNPDLIVDVIPPPGWIVLNPADTAHTNLDYPFYRDYLECGIPGQAPWDENYTAPLAFRPLLEADALSATNPTVHITLITQNAVRSNMNAWAGGDVQVLEGPVSPSDIPMLSRWGLLVIVLLLIGSGAVLTRRARKARL